MEDIMKTTNSDLAVMIGELRGDVKSIKLTVDKLDRSVNGNGKPGLIEEHRCLDGLVRDHLKQSQEKQLADEVLAKEAEEAKKILAEEAKEASEKLVEEAKSRKEKISNRTWAVVLAFVGAFATQIAILIFVFIKAGLIK